MEDPAAGETRQVGPVSPAMLKRSMRSMKPSAKAMEMNRRDTRVPKDAEKRTTKRTRRASSTDTDSESTINVRSETAGGDSERALLGRVLEEFKDFREGFKDLKEQSIKQQELICKLEREIVNTKEQLKQVVTQLEATTRTTITSPSPAHGQASYADVARTPPDSLPSNIRTLSSGKY
ncbi:hypothetical protein TGAMA5MH_11050 [Trichoderma gamsii]|uniref:Uncharacterized protein n=1 Tax=Trichoderma gamsii TaxID=398673 RepID=A0A2K0SUV0_9HYPO|nr:hypothetical protein TGAMA5MH_11050 [Trichoderma gamsii]